MSVSLHIYIYIYIRLEACVWAFKRQRRPKCVYRPVTDQAFLYACENDHAAVEKLKEELKHKVTVLPCMVDRICATRRIFADRVN